MQSGSTGPTDKAFNSLDAGEWVAFELLDPQDFKLSGHVGLLQMVYRCPTYNANVMEGAILHHDSNA